MNYYLVEIKGKNPKKLLSKIFKLNINLLDITYYKNKITFKVSYNDYIKINKIKTIYEVNIIDIKGIKKIKLLIKKYLVFLIFFVLGLLLLISLTKYVYFININTESKEMFDLIKKELDKNDLTIYSRKKSFKDLDYMTKKIKQENIDKIEWLSIYYDGTHLNIEVIERIKDTPETKEELHDIVASKNGYIKDIYSISGEILKVKDDYVKKGDVIISGNIFRNGKVIGKTNAKGKVYAEVWYKVSLNKSLIAKEQKKTDMGYKTLSIKLFNKDITLFKIKKKIKKETSKKLFSSKILSIYLTRSYIYEETEKKYNEKELIKVLEQNAREEINKKLKEEEYIISQKTLKNYKENGRIYIEVFFKVYQDIALEKEIQEIPQEEE